MSALLTSPGLLTLLIVVALGVGGYFLFSTGLLGSVGKTAQAAGDFATTTIGLAEDTVDTVRSIGRATVRTLKSAGRFLSRQYDTVVDAGRSAYRATSRTIRRVGGAVKSAVTAPGRAVNYLAGLF